MANEEFDPFSGGDSAPGISFKDEAIGTVKGGIVTRVDSVQGRKFGDDTGALEVWPNGQPKMTPVVTIEQADGEEAAFWVRGAMFIAFREKVKELGRPLRAGDRVDVKLTERKPTNKGNPANIFAVKVTPDARPVAAAAADPFGSDEPPF